MIFTHLFSNGKFQGALPYYLSASLNNISLSSIAVSVEETALFENYKLRNEQGTLLVGNVPNYLKFIQKSDTSATIPEIISMFGYMVSIGFLSYLKLLRMCFASLPFIGDISMIIIGNTVIHTCVCFVYWKLNPNFVKRTFFTIFYFLNPLIVVLYTFPYYYYLTVLPSAAAIYIYQKNYDIRLRTYLAIFLVLFFTILVRPPITPGILCLCLIIALLRNNFRNWVIFASMVVIAALFFINNQLIFGPWHTIYIGVGAYPNGFDILLTDQSTNDFYNKLFSDNKASYDNIDYMDRINLLKSEVFRLIYLDPILYAQNAFKNILHLYGLGYSDDYYWFRYVSMLVGTAFLLLLIYKKLYFHLIVIFTLNAGYVLYFPPIPMYMAGTYLLLIHGWLEILSKTSNNFSSNER